MIYIDTLSAVMEMLAFSGTLEHQVSYVVFLSFIINQKKMLNVRLFLKN